MGKDAVLGRLRQLGRPYYYVVTVTTRPQRAGETDGRDYHFVSRARFEEMIANGELMEWANVYGNYYGVPTDPVRRALARGQDVVVKPDVQGAATIKGLAPEGVFIFLAPPSIDELANRLRRRRTETSAQLDLRLRTAVSEMACLSMFDYVVVNYEGAIDDAVARIEAIILAEKCRVRARQIRL